MSVQIKKISPFQDYQLVPEIVRVHQSTPYREASICPVCAGKDFVSMLGHPCPICLPEKKVVMVENESVEDIVRDFYAAMLKTEAVCHVVTYRPTEHPSECVIGFVWGYQLKITQEVFTQLDIGNFPQKLTSPTMFYIDKIAVHPDYQGRNIEEMLIAEIVQGKILPKLIRVKAQSNMETLLISLGGTSIKTLSDHHNMITLS